MKFRYKVKKFDSSWAWGNPPIKIQRYHRLFSKVGIWLPFQTEHLKNILYNFNPDADLYTCECIYNELKRHGSMKELMMKYITEMAKDDLEEKNAEQKMTEFILADNKGWTTVEVKENETDG